MMIFNFFLILANVFLIFLQFCGIPFLTAAILRNFENKDSYLYKVMECFHILYLVATIAYILLAMCHFQDSQQFGLEKFKFCQNYAFCFTLKQLE